MCQDGVCRVREQKQLAAAKANETLTREATTNSKNFPLELVVREVETEESEFDPEFVRRFVPKLEWSALVGAAQAVSWSFSRSVLSSPSSCPRGCCEESRR